MTNSNQKLPTCEMIVRKVIILIYPNVTLLDVTGAAQVFGTAAEMTSDGELGHKTREYEVVLASAKGGLVKTDVGVELSTTCIDVINPETIHTLLVAGGVGVFEAVKDTELVSWFRSASSSAQRIGSTCMGAFLLSETGLNKGMETTTHWRWTDALQQRYSEVEVNPNPIFIRNGKLWSSAGVTSSIDMSLSMVEEDRGHVVSIQTAKAILVYFKRPGAQSQFSNHLQKQSTDANGRFSNLYLWILENLNEDLSVEALASREGMSPRNFARVFKAATGITPAKAVELIRTEEAKNRLSISVSPIQSVVDASGFSDQQALRRAFAKHVGISPQDYQARFANERCDQDNRVAV